jgi:hypothetical protein
MVHAGRIRILTRSTQSVATENTERKTKKNSVPSVTQNSVLSVLLLLCTLAGCKSASDSPSPTVSHLLTIPQKTRYPRNAQMVPEVDVVLFLVWSDGKNESIPFFVPSDTPDDPENGLVPNPDLRVVSAAFDNPGVQVVYVFYKMYNANYFVFIYDPNAENPSDPNDPGNPGTPSTPNGGLDVTIDW